MLTPDEINAMIESSEKVDANHYTRNMSVRRKKTLSRLFLLAASGIPVVSLSIRHEIAMILINILLNDIARRDGQIVYDPCKILDAALQRAQRAAAGARLSPSRWLVRAVDSRRRWWWIPESLVTLFATSGRFELAPDDYQSVRPYPCAKLRGAGQGGGDQGAAGGSTPEIATVRAGEDTARP